MDILEILAEKNIVYKQTNNPQEIVLTCTAGTHEDKTPSLTYNLYKNIFHCWSCGFAGGGHKFLSSIGIITRLPIESKQPYRIELLKQHLSDIKNLSTVQMPTILTKAVGEFRGLTKETLKEFGAFYT